ncbi:MAG TPA: hypothetical protein VME40_11825 [Caulobacteraceae bacterium]|nr:hypothetical protein [Caulobacteraceae bacterium]
MSDPHFDPRPLRQARALLAPPPAPSPSLRSVALSAALFAICALCLVALVVATPSPWPT